MQQELAKSRDDLRGGLEAAKRMVRERCQLGEEDDSQVRTALNAASPPPASPRSPYRSAAAAHAP